MTVTVDIRHGYSAYSNGLCSCSVCKADKARYNRGLEAAQRERRLTELAVRLTAPGSGVRVFHGIRCAECGAGLHDEAGRPRWDILWPLRFVCTNGCEATDE